MRTVTYTLPSHWSGYLINGDADSLNEEEAKQADEFLSAEGLGAPVSCDDAGFRHHHDARHYGVPACDCQEFTFLIGE